MGNILSSLFGSNATAKANAIAKVKSDVNMLIIKLSEEELEIDQSVQSHLLNALTYYSQTFKKASKKRYTSSNYGIKKLIDDATNKLTLSEDPNQMKQKLLCIKTEIQNNETHCNWDFEKVLKTVVFYMDSCSILTKDEQNELSVLVLELYIKSPAGKITDAVEQSLNSLKGICRYFENLNMTNAGASSVEEIRNKLEEVKCISTKITHSASTKIDVLETSLSKLHSFQTEKQNTLYTKRGLNPESDKLSNVQSTKNKNQNDMYLNILNKAEKELIVFERTVGQLCAPIEDAAIFKIREKILDLLKSVERIPNSFTSKKVNLLKRGQQMVGKLEKISLENKDLHEKLDFLQNFESDLSEKMEKKSSFKEKIEMLQMTTKKLQQISENFDEVAISKSEIYNRINAFMMVEVSCHLRRIKDKLDHYEKYTREFGFPQKSHFYDIKREEISSLETDVILVPSENDFIDKRKNGLCQEINVILDLLAEKGSANQRILFELKQLENLEKHVEDNQESDFMTLQKFNTVRYELNRVGNLHQKLIRKKIEILHQMHIIEEKFYSAKFPEDIKTRITLLNKYEKEVLQFVYPISSEAYGSMRKEVMTIFNELEIFKHENRFEQDLFTILWNNVCSILESLEQNGQVNQKDFEHLQFLKAIENSVVDVFQSNLPVSRKIELFNENGAKLQTLKKNTTKEGTLKAADDVENTIMVKKFSIQLLNVKKDLDEIRREVQDLHPPIHNTHFMKNMIQIFSLKELLEDVPEGNVELDSQKQTYLQEVNNVLKTFDEQLACMVQERKHVKPTLELQNYFTKFDLNEMHVKKESLEFIHFIYERAQQFESAVMDYLGTACSVDYYIIHENLMRMVEELDKLNCEDPAMIELLAKTIIYIKKLVEHLEVNANDY